MVPESVIRRRLAEAIKKFNGGNSSLRVKGTAWVAGFPVRNIELYIPKNMHKNKAEPECVRDFLGPSIDLGFRLSKKASEARLILSPSLAYLIASAAIEREGFPVFQGRRIDTYP